ncbi:ROK family protein [Crossiella sp. CA198]|uniref:ROK family transcriptional regulator n=1 Tax=Crossiella sp. CA198 TaxID=3455607 RepID=UPI003F8D7B27
MTRERASLSRELPQSVLRTGTDARLLAEVIARGRVTRAELATATGISKPTVSESVRRLVEAALLDATGPAETGRRGRVGTFYELGTAAGWVLAVVLDQAGVRARSADLAGTIRHEHTRPPGKPGDSAAVASGLRAVVRHALAAIGPERGPLRAVAVSVANPVAPGSREVVALPGSPFPEGLVSPADILAEVTAAPVLVDNDVNLAALAEHRCGGAAGADSFAYLHIGAGLGVGLYLGDRLIRGAHGLAGEIGYLPGAGEDTLAGELSAAGFGRTDVDAVLNLLSASESTVRSQAIGTLSAGIARAVASVTAVVDPGLVLLGGPVGTHPALLGPVRAAVAARSPAPVRLGHGVLGALAPAHGALHLALEHATAAAVRAAG